MKLHLPLAVFLVAILFISCEKEKKEMDTNNLSHSIYGTTNSVCPVAFVDTASFSPSNKLPDAPIQPVTSGSQETIAKNNYERIQWCLTKYKKAVLKNTGVFIINNTLILDNAILISEQLNWPVIKMGVPVNNHLNGVVKLYNNSRVAFLTVNANNFSHDRLVASAISILGSNNRVDNNWIMGGESVLQKTNDEDITGLYILCGENNIVQNNKITNNHYGIIVTNENSNVTSNVIDQNDIFFNRCDGISLMKYAKVTNNKLHSNGWDCRNGKGEPPIPGGGLYSQSNKEGAYIKGNEIYDNNGHNIDLINGEKFMILNNTLYNPGNKYFPGCGYGNDLNTAPSYGAAFSMSLVNIANSTIEGNIVRNENRSYNSVDSGHYGFDPNKFFSELNAPKFSDLPFNGSSIIAFCLAETDPSVFPLTGIIGDMIQVKQNIIRNNIFIASPNGIGYFSSRNTGFDSDCSWSAQTTNYFTLNNPTGSNHGSVRCGGNWYAANNVDRNTDDGQHVPPLSNWTGSDNKNYYKPCQ